MDIWLKNQKATVVCNFALLMGTSNSDTHIHIGLSTSWERVHGSTSNYRALLPKPRTDCTDLQLMGSNMAEYQAPPSARQCPDQQLLLIKIYILADSPPKYVRLCPEHSFHIKFCQTRERKAKTMPIRSGFSHHVCGGLSFLITQ